MNDDIYFFSENESAHARVLMTRGCALRGCALKTDFVIGNDSLYELLEFGNLRPKFRYVVLLHFYIITVDVFVHISSKSFKLFVICCIVLQGFAFVLMCCHLLRHLVLLCADLEKQS